MKKAKKLNAQKLFAAIDQLAAAHGYSTSGLAVAAGLDATTFNKSKRIDANGKERWPGTHAIALITAATKTCPSAFMQMAIDTRISRRKA